MTIKTTARTLTDARAILAAEGVTDPVWAGEVDDSDLLGCSLEGHLEWLRTADESELRGWARSLDS